MSAIERLVSEFTLYATLNLNEEMGLHPGYDQSKGNRCDRLTLDVMEALTSRGIPVRRELHMDEEQNWHYLLAHSLEDPSDDDLISSLNPWQWRDTGGGLLHSPRGEVLEVLTESGAPESFVALHSLRTIVKAHDTLKTPFVR